MTRGVLALMAGLLCALAGVKHAAVLKGDASRMNRWVQVLRHLTLLLKEGVLSIPEVLCSAADGPAQPDRLLRNMAARMQSSPMLTVSEAFREGCPPCPEAELLARMFTRLGRGSQESRRLAVEQSAEEMALMAQNASAKAEKDAKLWQTLGFIGGACLTILLL